MRKAAREFGEVASELAAVWKRLVNAKNKAAAASPIGFDFPTSSWISDDTLRLFAQFDLYRVGGSANDIGVPDSFSLPGSVPPFGMANQPDKIEPLSDQVEARCAALNAALKAHADRLKLAPVLA
jgi:hypothetical protein